MDWQATMACLVLVAENGGATIMARIGTMRALSHRFVLNLDFGYDAIATGALCLIKSPVTTLN